MYCCPLCLNDYPEWDEKIKCVESHGYETLLTYPADNTLPTFHLDGASPS